MREIGRVVRGAEREAARIDAEESLPEPFEPTFSTPGELSPVFGGAGAVFGAVGGMTEDARKAAERQIAKLKEALKNSPEAKAGRALRQKKVSTGAAIGAAKDLAKKAGQFAKKAKKGPPIRLGPTGAVIVGSQVLRDIDEQVREYQFGKMEDILERQQKESDAAVRRIRAKQSSISPPRAVEVPQRSSAKPPTVTKAETSRPVAAPSVSGIATAEAPKPLESEKTVSKPLAQNVPFATPAQMKVPIQQKAGRWIKDVAQLASLYNVFTGSRVPGRSKDILSGLVRTPERTLERVFAPSYSQARTATGTETCYQVCRSKSSGKKKRKSPKICISKTRAQRAGLI
jgi:hypothetical protein